MSRARPVVRWNPLGKIQLPIWAGESMKKQPCQDEGRLRMAPLRYMNCASFSVLCGAVSEPGPRDDG